MSPILKILIILPLYMFPLITAPSYSRWKAVHKQRHKFGTRLSNPLIDDGIIYLCAEKNLLFFQSNGSISRRIPLNYTCNASIPPVLGPLKMVYLVAENRVLRVSNTANTRTSESSGEVFLGPETGLEGMDEIIGLTVSVSGSCVLVNMHRRGLFAFRFDRRLKWSTGPFIPQNGGIHQGCRKNVTDCYFVSVPVLDLCDANFYIANNQGELYSVTTNSPRFEWIQDLSSLGKNFTITSGNNGQLYVTVQAKAVIVALDVLRGTILWQQSIGSLSAHDSSPVVDVNGWVSIGSLDGFLYSISPSGVVTRFPKRKIKDTVIQVNPIVDCSGYAVYISQTKMEGMISRTIREYTYVSATKPIRTTIKLLVPATGTVHWSESYPGLLSSFFLESDLRNYVVDERILLAFISSSNIGNPLSCFSTRQKLESSCSKMDLKKARFYTGNEKAIKIFLLIETILLILVAALARFCCVFWKKKKLQNQDLGNFLEKRSSLRLQKKLYDRTINELEKKAAEGPSTNEMLEKIGDLVKERENVERKLLTTYSLVRDATSPQLTSLIPLSDKKTISDTSSEEDIISNEEVEKRESKGKAPMVTESDDDGGDHEAVVETQGVKILDEEDEVQSGAGTSLRKRSRSLTRNVSSIE